MHLADPVFPPLLTGHGVNAPVDPFSHAVAGARADTLGAGDLVWAKRVDRFDCAIVLEPDVPGDQVAQMHYTAMVALADSLGALAPPEVGVHYRWPGTILVNGARAGEARFARDAATGPDGAPRWAVVGVALDIFDREPYAGGPHEAGERPNETTLFEEGCGELDRTPLLESFARHFLAWVDRWAEEGFRPVHDLWAGRREEADEISVEMPDGPVVGTWLGLDEDGALLLKTQNGAATLPLSAGLSPVPQQIADAAS